MFFVRLEKMGGLKTNLPLNGDEIIALGILPGKAVGDAIDALTEEWLEKPDMTKEDAKMFITSLIIF